jgi:hypothetical protein
MSAKLDLVDGLAIQRGFIWSLPLTCYGQDRENPIDLTGAGARIEFFPPVENPSVTTTFSVGSGHIVMGDEAGTIYINLSKQDVESIQPQRGNYCLILTDSLGGERVLLTGRYYVSDVP